MTNKSPSSRVRRQQGGYALMMVVFFTALLLVSTLSIAPRVLTEGRREKEQEMIWRGKQYTRGIKLYYRKTGRFPNSMDDLVKPKIGNIRFMRQAYKDPMNKDDGSWRLIYVGPAGQLIGSLKPVQNSILMPGPGGQPGTAAGGPGGALAPTSGGIAVGGSQTGGSSFGTGTTPGGTSGGNTGTGTGTPPSPGTPPPPGTIGPGGDSQPVPTGDTPTIIGGNIIGVGSKVNQSSMIVYEAATNYRLFEFIWDPSKDLGITGGVGTPIGTPPGTPGAPGQNPLGGQPNGTNPPPNPGGTPPNPNPPQQ